MVMGFFISYGTVQSDTGTVQYENSALLLKEFSSEFGD
jgi:hypothetical protein